MSLYNTNGNCNANSNCCWLFSLLDAKGALLIGLWMAKLVCLLSTDVSQIVFTCIYTVMVFGG